MRHFQPTAGIVLRFTRGRCRALPFALASLSCCSSSCGLSYCIIILVNCFAVATLTSGSVQSAPIVNSEHCIIVLIIIIIIIIIISCDAYR